MQANNAWGVTFSRGLPPWTDGMNISTWQYLSLALISMTDTNALAVHSGSSWARA